MWSPLLAPSELRLLSGPRSYTRGFFQELAHFAVHGRTGSVLWCDGDHGFNPYDLAELNLERGFDADHGAERVLIKRCMTPFQWETVLNRHLDEKLVASETAVVLVSPFESQFSTDELKDWEQEDYVRHTLAHLRSLARRFRVPILLGVDMPKWWKNHPVLAQLAFEGVDSRWAIQRTAAGWRVLQDSKAIALQSEPVSQFTLWEYESQDVPVVTPVPVRVWGQARL